MQTELDQIREQVIILTDVIFEESRYISDQVPEYVDCDLLFINQKSKQNEKAN